MLAWRIDIGCDESPKAEPYGLDAFFFDVECTPQEDCGFTIGAAWWDTWFPVALAIAGADVGKLDVPLLTHKRHPTTWDDEAWFAGVGRGWQMLRNYEFSPLADLRASWRHKETLSKHQLAKISDRIINWIQARNFSVNVLASDMADIEMALHLGGKAMLQHERALAIENSTTWRATAPLRSAINSLRFRSRVLLSQRG